MPKDHMARAHRFLETLATYRKSEDLINIGAYAKGSNPKIDHAIKVIDGFNAYLKQEVDVKASLAEIASGLTALIQ